MNGKSSTVGKVERLTVGEGTGRMTVFVQTPTVEPKVVHESVSKINETVIDIRADPEHIEHASEHVFAQGEEAIFEQVGENRAEVTIDFEEASGITRELRQEGVAGQEAVVQRQTDNIQRVLEVAAQQPVNQVVGLRVYLTRGVAYTRIRLHRLLPIWDAPSMLIWAGEQTQRASAYAGLIGGFVSLRDPGFVLGGEKWLAGGLVMYGAGMGLDHIGKGIRAWRTPRVQPGPADAEGAPAEGREAGLDGGEDGLAADDQLSLAQTPVLSGEAGPDYWSRFVEDSKGKATPQVVLQSIVDTCQLFGVKVDIAQWQQVNIPRLFNHIMGFYDARNVDFWNDQASSFTDNCKSADDIASAVLVIDYCRVMSQGSDETNKSTFVWEDPATERTLVKDLVKEFKKEGIPGIFRHLAQYTYQGQSLRREVSCEVALKALLPLYIAYNTS